MKDQEILDRIARGEDKVLEYLYKKHYKMMLNIVLKNNGTEAEAQDVFQETLIAFWQKAVSGKLVMTSKISTYLYSICLNQWRKELERRKRLSYEEKEGSEEQTMDDEERYKIVMKCIDELGDPCKTILTSHYFEGLNMTELAKKMNFANSDTAKTKKYKCKQRLDLLIKQRFERSDFFN
jgi:RNA polymerase sigma factor (sigma-70 family)